MKVDIRALADALFSWRNDNYIDMNNGELLELSSASEQSTGYLRIPKYSGVYLRQQYMCYMYSQGVIPETQMREFLQYPTFSLDYDVSLNALGREYVSKAHKLCEALNIEDTSYDLPDQKRALPTFGEFEDTKEVELAKEWCQKNGIAFYDPLDIPCSAERQLAAEEFERRSWREWYEKTSGKHLYTPEIFERIVEERIQKMHDEWLQKKAKYEERHS